MSFSSMGLDPVLLRAVTDAGYSTPTPIQAAAIPLVLGDRDLMATAQTGTGKTAAFTLPLLQRLLRQPGKARRPRALVLVPTRELAQQVADAVRTYSRHAPVKSAAIYGGVNINPQTRVLRGGCDVLVATPGRLIDHMTRRNVDLSGIEVLVLDEADRMLDLGFMPAIERIVAAVPTARQTLLFSATFSTAIRRLAQRFLRNPESIDMAQANTANDSVTQNACLVEPKRKRELLVHLFREQSWQQVLVFTRTKDGADRLAQQLEQAGIEATAIHGDKSQFLRRRALADFRAYKVRALVATDVAARGIDINELPQVVNYDLPYNPEDYVHRIGRTGRAGRTGSALSLVAPEERRQFMAIQRLMQRSIPALEVPGFDLASLPGFDPTRRPRPENNRRPRSQGPRERHAAGARTPRAVPGADRAPSAHPRKEHARKEHAPAPHARAGRPEKAARPQEAAGRGRPQSRARRFSNPRMFEG